MRSTVRLLVFTSLSAALLLVTAVPALGADATWGQVGPYKAFDSRSDPSTLCAYPEGGVRLRSLRVRSPRVDLPSQQEVGWVEWRLLVQRATGDGQWKTVARRDPVRRTVTLGFPMTFPTQDVRIEGQTGSAAVRLVWRLNWFDQGNESIGGARHAVVNYGLVRYDDGPPTSKPISWQGIERRTKGSCPNRWTS